MKVKCGYCGGMNWDTDLKCRHCGAPVPIVKGDIKNDFETMRTLMGGEDDSVGTLTVETDGVIYVGGIFNNIAANNGDYIVSWNNVTWDAVQIE